MNANTILLLVAGLVGAGLGIKMSVDSQFAENYAEKSPKAWLWRNLFGIDRASFLIHRIFGPVAIILGLAMIAVGVLLASGKI